MTDEIQANIDLVLAALNYRQSQGLGPERGEVTPEWLAYFAKEIGHPVSASTWWKLDRTARDRFRLQLAELAFDAADYLHRNQP